MNKKEIIDALHIFGISLDDILEVKIMFEKEEPRKPYFETDKYGELTYDYWYCPNCDDAFEKENRFNYCPRCGQRITHEVEEDEE